MSKDRNYKTDLAESSRMVPIALDKLGIPYFNLINCETSPNEYHRRLDVEHGIDYLLNGDDLKYGLASRIRFATSEHPTVYPEFTIRFDRQHGQPSEFDKRVSAIQNGGLYPALTAQAWFKGDVFIMGAVVDTVDLFRFCQAHAYTLGERFSNAWFYTVDWGTIQRAGYQIKIIRGLDGSQPSLVGVQSR